MLQKIKREGVSLRTVHSVLIVLAVVVSGLLIYATYHSSSTFLHLSEATDEYITLQKAAYELMDASDYLTEEVRLFTRTGDPAYMNNYFREANETRRRDRALQVVKEAPNSEAAFQQLQLAMGESVSLMDREYYAMKLVVEARGITECPDEIRGAVLDPADAALSPEEKMEKAADLVNDEVYYEQKQRIHDRMTDSISEIETLTHNTQTASSKDLKSELQIVRVIIIVQAIGILFMIWLTARLGINPVLKAVDRIKEDSPLPVIGANEFRYLARTYNKMYDVYKRSVEHLNYKASHDELTQLYNRAGYDLLVTSIELSTTIMLVIDVDNFKQVNDEFGHEMGDKVLKRVARTIKGSFRSDDYVCRVGGDEFVVLMVHADESQRDLIAAKIDYINNQLMVPSAGLPAATVSAGVAFGSRTNDPNELFNRADSALYETKHRGRHGITFYEEEAVPTFSENV